MIKKLGKKKMIVISLCFLLILTGSAVFFLSKDKKEENTEEEIVLKQGQSLVYGQIVSIYGNEITYYVMGGQKEAPIELEDSENNQVEKEQNESVEEAEGRERPQMPMGEDGERPQMPMGEDGERPQMPSGGRGQRRQSTQESSTGSMEEENDKLVTKESVTVQIPVGTQVTTRLGTVTTFSRLAAGDNIKMLVQEENGEQEILEMWIVD